MAAGMPPGRLDPRFRGGDEGGSVAAGVTWLGGGPSPTTRRLVERQARALGTIGSEALLQTRKLALLCSRACPGSIIVQTLDVVRALRETAWTVVSGFQSPTEQECLEILLRGGHPVIVCPARSVERMRISAAWKAAVAAGRMLITSPFEETVRRATAATAEERNRFVVSLADAIFIPHAAPGGGLERLCQMIPATGKRLWTLADDANGRLLEIGAEALCPKDVRKWSEL